MTPSIATQLTGEIRTLEDCGHALTRLQSVEFELSSHVAKANEKISKATEELDAEAGHLLALSADLRNEIQTWVLKKEQVAKYFPEDSRSLKFPAGVVQLKTGNASVELEDGKDPGEVANTWYEREDKFASFVREVAHEIDKPALHSAYKSGEVTDKELEKFGVKIEPGVTSVTIKIAEVKKPKAESKKAKK